MINHIETFEESWELAKKKPDPNDKFWKFRHPAHLEDRFGTFSYSKDYLEILGQSLNEEEMVALYHDLKARSRHGTFTDDLYLLTFNAMDTIAQRMAPILAGLPTDNAIPLGSLQVGDRYRQATFVYPSANDREVYVRGETITSGGKFDQWMGPMRRDWLTVDIGGKRSGVKTDFDEGFIYYWFTDAALDTMRTEASKLNFWPDTRLTPQQNIEIVYT